MRKFWKGLDKPRKALLVSLVIYIFGTVYHLFYLPNKILYIICVLPFIASYMWMVWGDDESL